MRQQRVVFHLAWIGLLFLAAAGGPATIGCPIGVAPEGDIVSAPDSVPAVVPATDKITPVACKMERRKPATRRRSSNRPRISRDSPQRHRFEETCVWLPK